MSLALTGGHGVSSPVLGQIALISCKGCIEPIFPWKDASAIRPDDLPAVEIAAAMEPRAPAEMLGVMALRDWEGVGGQVCENGVRPHAARQHAAGLRVAEQIPHDIVRYLVAQTEHDEFRRTGVEREPGRVRKARLISFGEDRCAEPAMLANIGDERSLMLVKGVVGSV